MQLEQLDIPHGRRLPSFLQGLRIPATKDEALDYAEGRGASEAALEYLEALPAAIFHSPEGLEHAFANFEDREVEGLTRETAESEDGPSD